MKNNAVVVPTSTDGFFKASLEVWYDTLSFEVQVPDDNFLKIKETLTRIGLQGTKNGNKALFQSCHILQKRGKYFIVHFKELFLLDGKSANYNLEDVRRRNLIVSLLYVWGMITLKDEDIAFLEMKDTTDAKVSIISYDEKDSWELIPSYTIGGKK